MNTIEIEDATKALGEYAREAAAGPLIITRRGKPIAVLLPLGDIDLETASLTTDAGFLELIERSRSRLAAEGGLSSDEVRRRLGLERQD